MKMIHNIILFLCALLLYTTCVSSSSSVKDFCVADLTLPNNPSGYPCKSASVVTVNDFVFSNFVPGNTITPFNVEATFASVTNFPGVNGLGISAARVDMNMNESVPMHTHSDATELLFMIQAQLISGFITPTDVFVKTISPGDVMVFPQGLLHFQVNSGPGKAIAFSAYTSSNPSLQILDDLLFSNNLSTSLISQTTFLDSSQIRKLKALFGGTVFFCALLSYTSYVSSSSSSVKDFCVADLTLPNNPSGYPCKSPSLVTVNDFVFSNFVPGKTITPFNFALTIASVTNFPGINGLGISAARLDMNINGTVPMHIHPDATELLFMIQGQITTGFITPTDVFVKTISPGDVMVYPQGLLHFVVNSGPEKAIAFIAYTSSNPNLHILDHLLFANNLSTSLISQTTFLDSSQIGKLKAQFGGTG
ncbi:putative germin-like protein subfamily 1 member 12 [Cicer arietinum]|uniref:Uncharacterized protein LOC101508818 n=1 Tax=Cicer arietinum TaxID=3827 RepID=A0A1S2YV81_CICAR|nr:uncharacterized protein LOC101508818 [Cicer arietinum]